MSQQTQPLTGQDLTYLANTITQYIGMLEDTVLYKVLSEGTRDAYNQPTLSFAGQNIQAVITDLSNEQYHYVEPGFLPAHYAILWTKALTPQVGDHVLWHQIEWEVRNSVPIVIGSVQAGTNVIYYQTLIRRVLNAGTLQAGG